jgi:plastocyanin
MAPMHCSISPYQARLVLLRVASAAAALCMLLAGCGQSESTRVDPTPRSISTTEVTIRMQGTHYTPNSITIPVDRPLFLTLVNDDSQPHDMILHGLSQPVHVFVDSGRHIATSLFFPSSGTFRFVCSQPGHEAAGMFGTIISEQ